MTRLKVLICGGGCAGPALAFWLARLGHRVTIVERHPVLRAAGAQIDFREQGIDVLKRMGLLNIVKYRRVDEAGMAFVDDRDEILGAVMANTSGKGPQTGTSEYEIMRGDLVRILYDATRDDVEYLFDKSVETFEQDNRHVNVRFSDGSSGTFDLLVGADGQGSRVRKAIHPADAPDPYRKLGMHAAYWIIPRTETDKNMAMLYHAAQGRAVLRRSHNASETQVYLLLKDSDPETSLIHRASTEQQKQFWTHRFRAAGWETGRFLQGMKGAADFYSQEAVQVVTRTWYKGRVVLVGDAAHCPSPFSAMGTTGAFVGAYVLAGEIARSPGDLGRAFESYDRTLRPFVDEVQELSVPMLRLAIPDTRVGVVVLRWIVWIVCLSRIPQILVILSEKFSKVPSVKKGRWELPDYPELTTRHST